MLQFSYLNNVTITGNTSNGGGGINHDGRSSGSFVRYKNTIVVGNSTLGGQPSDCVTSGGAGMISEGYNLVGLGTGCPAGGTGDLTTTTPATAAHPTLANNGGPTFTHALLAGSRGDQRRQSGGPRQRRRDACELLDQRGFARPDRCDIGAYEFGGAPVNSPPTATGDTVHHERGLGAHRRGARRARPTTAIRIGRHDHRGARGRSVARRVVRAERERLVQLHAGRQLQRRRQLHLQGA